MSVPTIEQQSLNPLVSTSGEKLVIPTPTETSVGKIAARVFLVLAIILAPFTLGVSLVLAGIVYLIYTKCCQKTKKIDAVANAQLNGTKKKLDEIDRYKRNNSLNSQIETKFNESEIKEVSNILSEYAKSFTADGVEIKKIIESYERIINLCNSKENSQLSPYLIKEISKEINEIQSKFKSMKKCMNSFIIICKKLPSCELSNNLIRISKERLDLIEVGIHNCNEILHRIK